MGADVYNKIDSISIEQLDKIARQLNTIVISCEMDLKCGSLATKELHLIKISSFL